MTPPLRPPSRLLIEPGIKAALREDMGRAGDVTSELIIPADQQAKAKLIARRQGYIAGLNAAQIAFQLIEPSNRCDIARPDGSAVEPGATLATISGSARAILTGERVALNFLGHLSGVATATARLVEAVKHTKARIVCTRKTLPNLRVLQKYAVRCGGGFNHRFGLDDAVLIKDNHIAAAGGIRAVLTRAKGVIGHLVKIEIEVDSLDQLQEVLDVGLADVVLIDNFDLDSIRKAVGVGEGRVGIAASGG